MKLSKIAVEADDNIDSWVQERSEQRLEQALLERNNHQGEQGLPERNNPQAQPDDIQADIFASTTRRKSLTIHPEDKAAFDLYYDKYKLVDNDPPGVAPNVFKVFRDETYCDKVQRSLEYAFIKTYPPVGFDPTMWEKVDDKTKLLIVETIAKHKVPKKSNVLKFFSLEDNDINFDASINSLALVCALVLTIPYGVASSVGFEFFAQVKSALQLCSPNSPIFEYYNASDSADFLKQLQRNSKFSLALTIYLSMSALILSGIYNLFRPTGNSTLWPSKLLRKIKILTFFVFVCTILSVLGVLFVASIVLFFVANYKSNICTISTDTSTVTGIFATCSAFVGGVYLMM